MRRALARRDGHCCYPGCEIRRTEGHHIRHWADGGPTSLDNLASLCSRHHHRHHEGGYRIERRPGGELAFFLPDGTLVPQHPSPVPLAGDRAASFEELSHIAKDACTPHWYNDPFHLADTVEALLQADHQLVEDLMQASPPRAGVGAGAGRLSASGGC
ncbi:MAG: HNH endonuclease signature motif containing protein [Acidimicrobiales bacterium]